MKHLKLFFALFAMLALGVGNAWAEEVTYVFTSKDWAAKIGSTAADWTSNKAGAGFSNNGIQVTTAATGANGTSPISYNNISQIVVTYNTNTSKGKGTLSVKIGDNAVTTNNWQYSGSANGTSANFTSTFDYSSPQSGKVTLTANTTTNSIYVVSIKIITSAGGGETPGTGGGSANVTYDFTKIDGFSSWGNSYSSHEVTYSDAKVTFEAASKQTSNITDCPVTKGKSVVLVMTDGSKLSNVKWVCKQWTTKTQTITLYYSTNGGGTYTSTGITSTNFSISSDNLPAGTNAVKITFSSTDNQVGISSCTITKVSSGSTEPTPSVSVYPTSHTFATTNVGETATQEFTITAKNTTETLSAEISNTTDYAISLIADNKITVTYQPQTAKTHEATLTIKAGDEASAAVALTGKAVAALEGTWILVTDASSLKAGDEIIIASKDENYALSIAQNTNNRGQVEVAKTDNTITATTEAQVLTLQAGNKENTLALYTGDGYLYAASSSNNYLRTETTLSDNSSWTIAIADGTATLTAQGTNTKNTLYYNKNSKIFSCYSNTQQEIAIYKNTNGQQLAGLAYATTKYLTKLGDAFTTPTLTNSNSLTVTYNSSDNNVATVDNTGALTIKAAGVVTITATFAGDASYLEGSAKYTLCVTEHAGTEADPYSVADARRVIDVMETAEGVYATGIVSEIVTAYNSTFGNITYNISIDGSTAADQLQAYRGKGVNGENFSSADDIKTGDEVVVKGNLKKHNTTYEFDADNQLVSLKRDKQQAGLAYEEKEHTANVGEDFTEPTLTNPNSLTVTYSSSNTALATVDATTGEVSILAAGKVTITASSAADATYAAGSASYNITISDPSLAIATLPFYFDGKRADIEGTAGMTQSNLGTDYAAAPYLKFNAEGAWAIVQFDSEPGEFSFLLKQNGESIGTFTVYESENGEDYTPVWSGGDLGGNAKSATIEPTLSATARYVKFEYTTKPTGTNYGLGEISIKKADHRQEAGLAWNPATISLTVGDAFTAPTFSNPNDLTGITFNSDNTALATVSNAGVISLVSGKTGTATITATFAGDLTYKPATATCIITVNEYIETIDGEWQLVTDASKLQAGMEIIIASVEVDGKYYTMSKASDNGNNRTAVESTISGDKLNPAVGTTVLTLVDAGNGTFALQASNGQYLYAASNTSNHLKETATINDNAKWAINVTDGKASVVAQGTYTHNIIRYNSNSTIFSCYASGQKDIALYKKMPDYNRVVDPQYYGTICLPKAGKFVGGSLYEVAYYDVTTKKVYFDEVLNGEMEAGMPYIFLANATMIEAYYTNDEEAAAKNKNGLYGTLVDITSGMNEDGVYMIYRNQIIHSTHPDSYLKANRAYIKLTEEEVPGYNDPSYVAPAPAPGRKRIAMGTTGQNTATGVDQVQGDEVPTKMIINGQLFILRGEKMYDAQGKLVK